MGAYTTQDLYFTTDGDFAVDATGDLAYADTDADVRQEAIINLYTPVGEFPAFPLLGSNLVDFIGEANTKNNAGLMKQEVVRALTQYAGFDSSDLTTVITPIAVDAVMISLTIANNVGTGPQSIYIDFNYIAGPTIIEA